MGNNPYWKRYIRIRPLTERADRGQIHLGYIGAIRTQRIMVLVLQKMNVLNLVEKSLTMFFDTLFCTEQQLLLS